MNYQPPPPHKVAKAIADLKCAAAYLGSAREQLGLGDLMLRSDDCETRISVTILGAPGHGCEVSDAAIRQMLDDIAAENQD